MKSIRNRRAYLALAAILFAAAAVFFIFRRNGVEEVRGRLVSPRTGTITTYVEVTGSVLPKNRLEIKPPVNGRVEKIFVEEGEPVRKGKVLAIMSSTERAALIDAARLEGPSSMAYWEKVYKPIPIITPITGEVIVRAVEPGQTVTSAAALLVISDRLIVRADVDETDIARVGLGQEAEISLDAHPEVRVAGKVSHIYFESKSVNNVNMYQVEVQPSSIPGIFRSGMTADIKIIDRVKNGALLIPVAAVILDGGKSYVRVRVNKKYVMREISPGLTDDLDVEVLSGLGPGEQVLIAAPAEIISKDWEGATPFFPSRKKSR